MRAQPAVSQEGRAEAHQCNCCAIRPGHDIRYLIHRHNRQLVLIRKPLQLRSDPKQQACPFRKCSRPAAFCSHVPVNVGHSGFLQHLGNRGTGLDLPSGHLMYSCASYFPEQHVLERNRVQCPCNPLFACLFDASVPAQHQPG